MALGLENIIAALNNFKEPTMSRFAQKLQPLMDEITKYAISMFYSDWSSSADEHYIRTGNFMNGGITLLTPDSEGIDIEVFGGLMGMYPGWSGNNMLAPDPAFDFFFENGEHGHGRWLAATTKPPGEYYDERIDMEDSKIGQLLVDSADEVLSELL